MRTVSLIIVSVILFCDTSASKITDVKSSENNHGNNEAIGDFITFETVGTSGEDIIYNLAETTGELFTTSGVLKDVATTFQSMPVTTSEHNNHDSKLETKDTETETYKDETFQDRSASNVASHQNIMSALKNQADKKRTLMPNHKQIFRKGKHSRKFLMKTKLGSGITFSNKKAQQESEGDYQEGDVDVSESDYDYEDGDSIYTLAHFRQELYDYVDENLAMVNGSLLQMIKDMQDKIIRLETQLHENSALTCALESRLRVASNPQRGDIRFLKHDKCGMVTKAGYLQFYTGTEWGFVCDDFFNMAAAKVACKQLGFPETTDALKSTNIFFKTAQNMISYQYYLTDSSLIVLDDVQCRGDENSLDSCDHYDLGKHDCSIEEIVFLTC